jgi:hypothetical protein
MVLKQAWSIKNYGYVGDVSHIHSTFIDGKRVSRHAMKDCTTFLKLQEAALNKQAEAKR